jgi:hypothetical protein
MRQAIETMLAAAHDQSVARQIVEGYQRTPPAIPDEWGWIDDMGDGATAEVLWRLDEEERRGGSELGAATAC